MKHSRRIALYVLRGDLLQLGWWLRRSLSVEHRRRLGLILLRDEPLTLEFEGDGFMWRVPVGDEITRTLFATGGFDIESINRLHAMFGPGTLLEIGANVGTTTLPLARLGWEVIAVEPVPALHAFLAANVERNALSDRVTVLEAAVALTRGRASMVVPHGMFGSSYVEGHGHFDGDGERVEVETITLDDLVADRNVTLVWCDAEGSEGIVIEAGLDLWMRGVPLYVELSPEHVPVAQAIFATFRAPLDAPPRPTEDLTSIVVDQPVDVLLQI